LILIYRLLQTHSCKTVGEIFLILTKAKGAPFSFFSYIFWHESIDLRSDAGKQMMQHELTHVQQKHSIDKIFMQLVLIAGWFNPFFWLIKKEMEMIHEFIADKKAVANGDTASLAQMLLAAAYPQQHYLLTNPFFFSPIKRRLQMITKNTNPRFSYMRRLIVLPLLAIVVVLFAFRTKELRNAEIISVGTLVDNLVDKITAKTTPVFSPINIHLNKQYTVVINAGHGGEDIGATAFDGNIMEKNLTLELAKTIQQVNQNNQIKIILTRETDINQTIYEVAKYTNQQSPDLFISLHCNTAPKSLATAKKGMEIYIAEKTKSYNHEESYLFANQMANSLSGLDISMTGLKSRKEGVYVLQNVKSPAILLETGYLSNSSDLNQLKNESYQQKLAASILNGVQYYFSNKEKGITIDTTILNSDSVYIIPKGKNVQFISEGIDSSKAIRFTGIAMQDKMNFNSKNGSVSVSGNGKENGVLKVPPLNGDSILPLFVIDGVKMEKMNRQIDPNSIKEITVLKNKSAVELYGEEGKHGVILITTKNKSGMPPLMALQLNNTSLDSVKFVKGQPLHLGDDVKMRGYVTVKEEGKINPNKLIGTPLNNGIVVEGYKLNASEKPMKVVQGFKINPNPLVIVNNQPVYDINFDEVNINPKDIESVNVLKGESATKKYGDAAEYGALEIKTKTRMGFSLKNITDDPSGTKAFLIKNPAIKRVSWNNNPLRMNLEFKDGSIETYDLSNSSSVEKAMKKYGKLSLPTPPAPPPPPAPSGRPAQIKEESYDKVFTKTEVPAEFKGGLKAWAKFLNQNIKREIPIEKGGPPGKYTVNLSFIIDKEGKLSEIKAENNPGYGTAEEAVRVMKLSPNWEPAKHNGETVTYKHKQSITYFVTDESKLINKKKRLNN
jgi:N-acetylmuramoyl-L-alanine amidase